MEVFDFEEDHLNTVLPQDREDTNDEEGVDQDEGIFISPTEQERRQQQHHHHHQQQQQQNKKQHRHDLFGERSTNEYDPAPANTGPFSTCGIRMNNIVDGSSSLDRNYTTMSTKTTLTTSSTLSHVPRFSAERNTSSERYQHLPSYAQSSFVSQQPKDEEDYDNSECRLSIDLPPNVPEGMHVPQDVRIHEILKRTAERVVTSPQLQIMLKVKQELNPDFAFLHNKYVAYYEWYKHHYRGVLQQQQQEALPNNDDDTKKNSSNQDGSMQSLFGMYSSSSDDGSCSSHDEKKVEMEEEKDDDDTKKNGKRSLKDDDHQRADRLKRAKMLKEHFQRKLESSSSCSNNHKG